MSWQKTMSVTDLFCCTLELIKLSTKEACIGHLIYNPDSTTELKTDGGQGCGTMHIAHGKIRDVLIRRVDLSQKRINKLIVQRNEGRDVTFLRWRYLKAASVACPIATFSTADGTEWHLLSYLHNE
jgi:hypothetical protein